MTCSSYSKRLSIFKRHDLGKTSVIYPVESKNKHPFFQLNWRQFRCLSAQETIGAFFNSAWFRAVDVEFAEEELSLLPISSVQRQADSGGGCTIWCRSKAVAEVVLTRLKGISYQGRTLEIFKLAGAFGPNRTDAQSLLFLFA